MAKRPAASQNPARRLLAAWTLCVLVFLYLPIALLILYSFRNWNLGIPQPGYTFHWYRAIFDDAQLIEAIQNSLLIAAATTAISVVMGTVSAWLLHRYRFGLVTLTQTLLAIPMMIPEVIMGISLMLFFQSIGLNRGFCTVIIAHVTFCVPFVMAAVQARLAGLDPSLEEAALDLGAPPAVAFTRVILPCLMPGIIAGALLAFTLSLDEFVVTYFTYSARAMTLPVKIYSAMRAGVNPRLNAVSTLFIVATALLVVAADALRGAKHVKRVRD